MFTDLTLEKIEKIKNKNINQLKIILANECTKMLHGNSEAKLAEETARKTFEENLTGSGLPTISVSQKKLSEKINIIDLVVLSKLESSKSEIRRLIKGNGIKINNQLINDEKFFITKELFSENFIKLSLGKKRHIKVKLN
jgi:tyrosyl-tRNA synthetase